MAADIASVRPHNSALKDARLQYRACTLGYAQSLQLSSPTQLVGQTDFDFLSDRGAALVNAAECRVLETGVAEITSGEILSKRTAGKYFVRSPVFNRSGQICGIEIFVVSVDELHKSYKLLLDGQSQLRDVINQSPFGLLIHRDYEVVYLNETWLQLMGSAGSSPSADELRRLIPEGAGERSHSINSVHSNGKEMELRLQTRTVNWNATAAQAVYCFPTVLNSQGFGRNLVGPFVEKRHGHRRTESDRAVSSGDAFDEEFFNHIAQPMIVCDGWIPVQANKAARGLLGKDTAGGFRSIKDWFSDRDRASVKSLSLQSASEQFVTVKLDREGQRFSAQISNIWLGGRKFVLISLQLAALGLNELETTIAKFRDYVSAAGDFFWEMDAEQRLTYVSVEMKDFLGVETSRVLNIPIDTLAMEYVHKDDQAEWKVLVADLRKHLPFRNREYKWLDRDGERKVVRLSGVPVFDAEDKFSGYRGIGWDYTAQHHSASIVAYHASHDSLTGLVNRREFEARCDEAIERSTSAKQALCFIDLDKFKRVNDTAGHLAGDELLRQLSKLFTGLVRRSDVLARLGGDEFGLLIYDVGLKEALRLATQLCAEVESFLFQWEGKQFSVGASIGLVQVDTRWATRSAMFGAADAACYQAKREGRNRVAVYDEQVSSKSDKQDNQQHDEYIRNAIAARQVKLAMQQIASLKDSEPVASKVEVLLRMVSRDGEMILPATILPAAERSGMSAELDKCIIDLTLEWLEGQPHVTDRLELCCINLSRASIIDDDFSGYLIEAISKASIDTSILCFEMSESALSSSLGSVSVLMEKLGKYGCQFAMDDFSGGMNALVCLKKLPVNYVKINGAFVKAILEDSVHYAMVKSINDVAQTLGKQTIAQSVESESVMAKLQELGIDLVQGYHVAQPEIIDF